MTRELLADSVSLPPPATLPGKPEAGLRRRARGRQIKFSPTEAWDRAGKKGPRRYVLIKVSRGVEDGGVGGERLGGRTAG
jgi:hypothetical protein